MDSHEQHSRKIGHAGEDHELAAVSDRCFTAIEVPECTPQASRKSVSTSSTKNEESRIASISWTLWGVSR